MGTSRARQSGASTDEQRGGGDAHGTASEDGETSNGSGATDVNADSGDCDGGPVERRSVSQACVYDKTNSGVRSSKHPQRSRIIAQSD
jgi:hypothetical protein